MDKVHSVDVVCWSRTYAFAVPVHVAAQDPTFALVVGVGVGVGVAVDAAAA